MFYDMECCLGALIFKRNFMKWRILLKKNFVKRSFIKLNFMQASVLLNRIFEGGPK